jgi:lipoate-protein ligase A
MHQNAQDPALSPRGRLAREWDLFQSVEAGAVGPLVSIWQASQPFVVVGRSGHVPADVIEDACHADGVEVLRRQSGGGSVVLAPGCLNYAVVLSLVSRPELIDVAASFRLILGRIVEAFELPGVSIAGGTDLAWDGRKVSGNAQRRGRRALLHHGTLLYAFDPTLAGRYLKEPARQPAYRAGREHADFLGNLPLSEAAITARLSAGLASLDPEVGIRD